jgi:uncharacterized protein YbjT (DUF2867 family)
MILVVGATGQLGAAVVSKLAERGKAVRALVRETSDHRHLERVGVEIAVGDLTDTDSLEAACQGADAVIATANSAVPSRKADSFKSVDGRGYENLIRACIGQDVRQFVYASVVSHPKLDRLPLPAQKRITEKRLQESGLVYTIFRADAFMDVTFPMMGSDIPLRGAAAATVRRPFWFSSRFFGSIKDNIREKGEAVIAGYGTSRHSYICIDDVSEFLVKAVGRPEAENKIFDIGGPEALSQKDVLAVYEKELGKPLKARHTPAFVFRLGHVLLRPFSPAASNIMGLTYYSATTDSIIEMNETAKIFDVRLTSAEKFLHQKATAD